MELCHQRTHNRSILERRKLWQKINRVVKYVQLTDLLKVNIKWWTLLNRREIQTRETPYGTIDLWINIFYIYSFCLDLCEKRGTQNRCWSSTLWNQQIRVSKLTRLHGEKGWFSSLDIPPSVFVTYKWHWSFWFLFTLTRKLSSSIFLLFGFL